MHIVLAKRTMEEFINVVSRSSRSAPGRALLLWRTVLWQHGAMPRQLRQEEWICRGGRLPRENTRAEEEERNRCVSAYRSESVSYFYAVI